MSHQIVKSQSHTLTQDQFKQPPIRIKQESIQILNTKLYANQKIYFDVLSQSQQRDLICLSEKDILRYNSTTDQYTEVDIQLRRLLKQTISKAISSNSNFICGLLNDGDLFIYKLKNKVISLIKGVQNQLANKEEPPQIYLNDEGSILIIKQASQDYFWIWNMAKDLQQQIQNVQELQVKDQQKKPLFRSSSFDKRSTFEQDQQLLQKEQMSQQKINETIRGSWQKIYLKDFGGPFQHRQSSFYDGFDTRFVTSQYQFGENIKIIQSRIYTCDEYFGGALKASQNNNQENIIIELNAQNFKVNYTNKGGQLFESSQSLGNVKSKISTLDFMGTPALKQKTLISRIDNSGSLVATVLNSTHMVYCQFMFSNFETSISSTIKLFSFISTDDCPIFDSKGKTNLVIDDFQWTNSDTFVIIVFNSSSFAILPRLGSSLIKIFNPTIINISQTMVDQFEQYKEPKAFNEIILPKQIQQKLQISKLSFNHKKLQMHPFEDSFLISDGQLCFVFKMEFEPELTDLFSKNNMSYYFLRFCISLDKLAIDPDILEKIPQLLTNKLPLFEFEKNAEIDEEEDPGQIIMTASQINPFEHGQKRMETNQSFNAEFTLDSSVVLLNLKHLLMGLRWNKNQPLNYYQWLITVVNDTFFYYLKQSEPVYAFHALRIAEAYCKKALYVTESEGDISLFESRKNEHNSSRVDMHDLTNLMSCFEVIHDIYDYHNTQEYMQKSTAEKIQIKYDMFNKLPNKILKGSGNWRFQFSKNYALLVYYSLIQFRNYQASNFNILFLVFACYILQRYLDSMFLYHLQKMIEIVYRNFQLKKKSDDYELFLGKSGKNFLIGPPEKLKVYQDWVCQAMKFTQGHLSQIYEQENIENIMDTLINEIQGNKDKVIKNIGFLGDFNCIIEVVLKLQENNYKESIKIINNQRRLIKSDNKEEELILNKAYNFKLGMAIYLISETLRRNLKKSKQQQGINIEGLIQGIQRMSIATSSDHCTDFVHVFQKYIQWQQIISDK